DEELGRAPLRGTGQDDPSSDPEWEAHVRGYFNREAFTDEAVPKASVEAKG
ncbi:MAG: hypothetical protein JO048_11410, partial [Methylobacteriaceae bacterium]|nr:hypothetical protein [Methylobacteriaceae bacterium]